VRHIRANAPVTLNLDSSRPGADIMLAEGCAELVKDRKTTATERPAFAQPR
jgi:hypothetical protein